MTLDSILPFIGLALIGIPTCLLVVATFSARKKGTLEEQIRNQINSSIRAQQVLTVEEFGIVERDFKGLTEVIVVCHMVENPDASLRSAVIDNFKDGVRYHFCVSRANAVAARRVYDGFFKSIFQIAQAECGNDSGAEICELNFADLFRISSLRENWTTWPYVFYVHVDDEGQTRVSAYRGDQRREGIAENYVQLRPTEAEAILNAVRMGIDGSGAQYLSITEGALYDALEPKVDAA